MSEAFTHKRVSEIKDSAPDFGYEEVQEARFATGDLNAEDTGVSFLTVKPGKRQGFAHRHEQAEEVYVVIAGSGRAKLDEEIIELSERDALRVSPGVIRQFEAGDAGLDLVAFGAHHEKDGEVIQDWWTD